MVVLLKIWRRLQVEHLLLEAWREQEHRLLVAWLEQLEHRQLLAWLEHRQLQVLVHLLALLGQLVLQQQLVLLVQVRQQLEQEPVHQQALDLLQELLIELYCQSIPIMLLRLMLVHT